MESFKISSVAEFHEMVQGQSIAPIYRGEDKATYSLLPKIGRCYRYYSRVFAEKQPRHKFSEVDEIMAFQEYKMRAVPYIQRMPKNDWEWLAIAQHHGLPTRLLDWTENPLVAVFFACYGQYTEDSVIYILDRRKFDVPPKDTSPLKIRETMILMTSHITPRVTAQSSLFTVHPNPDEEFDSPYLQRWIIKQSCHLKIALMLKQYGVNHASLFPGLEGVAKYLKHRWLLYSEGPH